MWNFNLLSFRSLDIGVFDWLQRPGFMWQPFQKKKKYLNFFLIKSINIFCWVIKYEFLFVLNNFLCMLIYTKLQFFSSLFFYLLIASWNLIKIHFSIQNICGIDFSMTFDSSKDWSWCRVYHKQPFFMHCFEEEEKM